VSEELPPNEPAATEDHAAEIAELQKQLASANERIGVLNKENEKRRRESGKASQEVEQTTAKLAEELQRRDAIEALRDAGANGDRQSLLKLTRLMDSLAPDDLAGEISALKEQHPGLFKAAKEDTPGSEEDPPKKTAPVLKGEPKDPPKKTDGLTAAAEKLIGVRRAGYKHV